MFHWGQFLLKWYIDWHLNHFNYCPFLRKGFFWPPTWSFTPKKEQPLPVEQFASFPRECEPHYLSVLYILKSCHVNHPCCSYLQVYSFLQLLNTYWATSSPISEVSMLPYTIVGVGEAWAHYWIRKHTNFWFGRDRVQIRVLVLPTPIFQYQKENHVWWVMAYSLASLAHVNTGE